MAQEQLYFPKLSGKDVEAEFYSIEGGRQPVTDKRDTLNQVLRRVDELRGELIQLGGAAAESADASGEESGGLMEFDGAAAEYADASAAASGEESGEESGGLREVDGAAAGSAAASDEDEIDGIVEGAKDFYETIMMDFFGTKGFCTVDVESWPAATTEVGRKEHFWSVNRSLAITKEMRVLGGVLKGYKPGPGAVVPVPRWFGTGIRGGATRAPMGLVFFKKNEAVVGRMFNLFYGTDVLNGEKNKGYINTARGIDNIMAYFVFSLAQARRLVNKHQESYEKFKLLFSDGYDTIDPVFVKEFTRGQIHLDPDFRRH